MISDLAYFLGKEETKGYSADSYWMHQMTKVGCTKHQATKIRSVARGEVSPGMSQDCHIFILDCLFPCLPFWWLLCADPPIAYSCCLPTRSSNVDKFFSPQVGSYPFSLTEDTVPLQTHVQEAALDSTSK